MPNCQTLFNSYQALLTAKHLFDASLSSAKIKTPTPDIKSGSQLERRGKFNKQTITDAVEKLKTLQFAYADLLEKHPEAVYNLFFERKLHLREQYDSQKSILQSVGLLEPLSNGSLGIIGISNKEYLFPSYQEVRERMIKQRETLEIKAEQGFTKLLIVPFGMPLDQFTAKYEQILQKHFDEKKLFHTKKDPNNPNEPLLPITEINNEGPLWIWGELINADINETMLYHPKELKKQGHNARTKKDILSNNANSAFTILLIEDMPNIPRQGNAKTKGKQGHQRTQLDTSGSSIKPYIAPNQSIPCPEEYLKAIQTDPQYQNEQGMTPEAEIIYAITHLQETNQIINDWQGNGRIAYSLGAILPGFDSVPELCWARGGRQAFLGRFVFARRNSVCGVRLAVGVL